MFPPVVTKDSTAVEKQAQLAYEAMFANADPTFVPRAFAWIRQCFNGQYQDYRPIDARYHDFEHTMQGTLCMMRLLHGRQVEEAQPALTEKYFQLGLLAILFHDTGYLKKRDDPEGTGAKYTATHVTRSTEFAEQFLRGKGFSASDIKGIQNMIQCTGVDAVLGGIPFQNELEKIVGHALGTADLVGQMAAEDYVDKLPILYLEFAEAAANTDKKNAFVSGFKSADDLMQKTPGFWQKYVLPKLMHEFSGVYHFLDVPYPSGPNEYLQRIEKNMDRLRQRVSVATK